MAILHPSKGKRVSKRHAHGLGSPKPSDRETAYLLGTQANAEHLRRALQQFEDGHTREQQ